MSLPTPTIVLGGTPSISGGSGVAFVADSQSATDLAMVPSIDAGILSRRVLRLGRTMPVAPVSSGAYAKLGRARMRFSVPFSATDGKIYQTGFDGTFSFHHEQSQAAKDTVINDAISAMSDSELRGFIRDLLFG